MRRGFSVGRGLLGLLLLRAVIAGVIIVLIVLLLQTCIGMPIVTRIDKTLPGKEVAPWQVTTTTHRYIAEDVKETETGLYMAGWSEWDGSKWVYHAETIKLPAAFSPRVSRR